MSTITAQSIGGSPATEMTPAKNKNHSGVLTEASGNFLNVINENLNGQLGSRAVVERNTIKDLGIYSDEFNIRDWQASSEDELMEAFEKKIEKLIGKIWQSEF